MSYVRSYYGSREAVQCFPEGESLTEQQHLESSDINNVINKYMVTGEMAPPKSPALYGDVTAFQADLSERYRESYRILHEAQEAMPLVDAERKAVREAKAAAEAAGKQKIQPDQ